MSVPVPVKKQNKNVLMEGVRLIFRNFAGKEGMYNREGDRSFNVVLPSEELALQMQEDGWKVKYKEPRDEGDVGIWILPVAISFKNRPPRVVMVTSKGRVRLPEELLEMLDYVDIASCDLIVNPYHWHIKSSGASGVKAYLQSLYVTIQEDELEQKYADVPEIDLNGQPAMLESGMKAIEAGQNAQTPTAEQVDDLDDDADVYDAELVDD